MHIDSLEEIKEKYKGPQNTNSIHKKSLSKLENLGLIVTNKVGTMEFFFLIFLWTICWLSWNIFAPKALRFDPYPAFVLWLFISNMIQIFLMPLLMVGQNIQGKHSDLRSLHDYDTDKKSEKEIETILLHLENQNTLILDILHRLETLEKSKKDS